MITTFFFPGHVLSCCVVSSQEHPAGSSGLLNKKILLASNKTRKCFSSFSIHYSACHRVDRCWGDSTLDVRGTAKWISWSHDTLIVFGATGKTSDWQKCGSMSELLSGCTNRNTNQSRTVKDKSGNAPLGHVTQSRGLLFPLRVCWEWIWGVLGGGGVPQGCPRFSHMIRFKQKKSLWDTTDPKQQPSTPQYPQFPHPSPFTPHH